MSFKLNPLTNTDSYKLGHMAMYPKGTEIVYSNFTPRTDKHLAVPGRFKDNKIVWFGIQATMRELHELWQEEFFDKPWKTVKDEFLRRIGPFVGDAGFDIDKVKTLHKLGYLPIRVKSLPEGSKVNIGVPVFTIMNTKPEFYWLTNYLETTLSNESWLMATSATIANRYKTILNYWANITGGNKDFIQWQAHDFSTRGMEGNMAAAKSGSGHLLSSMGTDSLGALDFIDYYYKGKETFIGASVPATEHSVMTFEGIENEKETIRRLIEDTYPMGIVSVVSDSFDFWKTITQYALELRDVIINRKPDSLGMAKVVFRPDSGNPIRIICGYEPHELMATELGPIPSEKVDMDGSFDPKDVLTNSEVKGAVSCLWEIFGGSENNRGFRTLNPRVGLIYGDSITPFIADEILSRLANKGFASDNVVFGIGSFTYQYNTRDTLGFAMKATWGTKKTKEGIQEIEIFKDPKTDSGMKKSAKGLLRVEFENDNFVLYDKQTREQEEQGLLKVVYEDGKLLSDVSFAEIRERLASQ